MWGFGQEVPHRRGFSRLLRFSPANHYSSMSQTQTVRQTLKDCWSSEPCYFPLTRQLTGQKAMKHKIRMGSCIMEAD